MKTEKTIKICLGVTKEKQIVFAELNIRNNEYYSITHDTLRELLTEEEGEQRGMEYLEDGELWKQAVDCNNTTQSLSDWMDLVLNTDGWETVIDARYFGEYEGQSYYSTWDSCGASIEDFKKNYILLLIPKEDIDLIIQSDKLHIKAFSKYNKRDKLLYDKIKKLMVKYEKQKDYATKVIETYLKEE